MPAGDHPAKSLAREDLEPLLDPEALARYLDRHLEGGLTGPLHIERHMAGHSNETFFVRSGADEERLVRMAGHVPLDVEGAGQPSFEVPVEVASQSLRVQQGFEVLPGKTLRRVIARWHPVRPAHRWLVWSSRGSPWPSPGCGR